MITPWGIFNLPLGLYILFRIYYIRERLSSDIRSRTDDSRCSIYEQTSKELLHPHWIRIVIRKSKDSRLSEFSRNIFPRSNGRDGRGDRRIANNVPKNGNVSALLFATGISTRSKGWLSFYRESEQTDWTSSNGGFKLRFSRARPIGIPAGDSPNWEL